MEIIFKFFESESDLFLFSDIFALGTTNKFSSTRRMVFSPLPDLLKGIRPFLSSPR